MIRALALITALRFFATTFSAGAQTNTPPTNPASPANAVKAPDRRERMRAECIDGRRSICGKILRIFPNGILVESGYTNLLREPLTRSWLVPGTVTATRAEHLVESREPGALCIGTVFLTNLPRGRPKQYDYVIICGYPTGEFTYTSVGEVRKTVRRFSANLEKAVQANLAAAQERNPSRPAEIK
jgi:hypothetical protein